MIDEDVQQLSFDDRQFEVMEKVEHRMNDETTTRSQGQTGILTIVTGVISVESEMIDIEESRNEDRKSRRRTMKKHSPNPMTFADRCVTTDTIVLIGDPDDQNDIKCFRRHFVNR